MSIEGDIRDIGHEFNRVDGQTLGINELSELRTWSQSLPSPISTSKTLHYDPLGNEEALVFAKRISESDGPVSDVRSDDFANALGNFTPLTRPGLSQINLNLDGIMAFASWIQDSMPEAVLMGSPSARRSSSINPADKPKEEDSVDQVYARAFDLAANVAKELIMVDVLVDYTWTWLLRVVPVAPLSDIYMDEENVSRIRNLGGLRLMRKSNIATKGFSSTTRRAIYDSLGFQDLGQSALFIDSNNVLLASQLEGDLLSSMTGSPVTRFTDSNMDFLITSPFESWFRRNVSWFSFNRGLTHVN